MTSVDDEMHQLQARIEGHDRHISDLSLVVFGNSTMHVIGLAERLNKIESMLAELVTWQREVKLLLKVGVGLLATITGGTGIMVWPQVAQILGRLAGG